MRFNLSLFLVLFYFMPSSLVAEPLVSFSTRGAESKNDSRYEYDQAVLKLALIKTVPTHGPFELDILQSMTFPRAVDFAHSSDYSNFFFKHTYEKELEDQGLIYVDFPIDLGIVGFRVCFTSKQIKAKLDTASQIEEIRRFTHGQGIGWTDVKILRNQGFDVLEVAKYESLFLMVASNRFDLFCRGVNELLSEYQSHKHIVNLTYDTSMALVYPLPRFFYTGKNNKQAVQRIKEGLEIAYNDGSLIELWNKHYGPSIDFAKLHTRKLYYLDNPLLEGLSNSYQKYLYDPLRGKQGGAALTQ